MKTRTLPKVFSCTYRNIRPLPTLTASKVHSGRSRSPLHRIISRIGPSTRPPLREEEAKHLYSWTHKRPKNATDLNRPSFCQQKESSNARWTMRALGEVHKQRRQKYAAAAKKSTFDARKAFLDPDNLTAPESYDKVANGLQPTDDAVKHLSIGRGSGTPHHCEKRSAARRQMRQRLAKRPMHSAKL
jgi:hypothetical protein